MLCQRGILSNTEKGLSINNTLFGYIFITILSDYVYDIIEMRDARCQGANAPLALALALEISIRNT